MDENYEEGGRGRNKLSRFRVRRDSKSQSKEREIGEIIEREGSIQSADQDRRTTSPPRHDLCSPSPSSIRSASSSYRSLYYSRSTSRSRSPTSPRPDQSTNYPSLPQTIHSQSLPISSTPPDDPAPRIKLYLPLPLHLPRLILSEYFSSLFPPIKIYSLSLHSMDKSPFAFIVVDRELWENGEIERRVVERSEGLKSGGKEWKVRLGLAKGEQHSSQMLNLSRPNSTGTPNQELERKRQGWIGIELDGFPEGTLRKENVEGLLGRYLKYWDRFEMDERLGWVRFEVQGVQAAGVVERNLGGLRIGNEGATIKVRVGRDREDISLEQSGMLAGSGRGENEREMLGRKESSLKRSHSPDSYGPAQPRGPSERERDLEVEERETERKRSLSRERGRSRLRANSRQRSRSRSFSELNLRNHGRGQRDRDDSRRKDRYEDGEDREERRSNRRKGDKKRRSHHSSSRSRSPRRRNTHHHSRRRSRFRSRSPNPRHRRHRKSSRRSPSLSPDHSSRLNRRSGYDLDSRSRSRSRSPRRNPIRQEGYGRSISPFSSHRRTYETNHDSTPFSESSSSVPAPHYGQPFSNSYPNYPNLDHFRTFPPQSQSYPQPHFPTYSQVPPPPHSYYPPHPQPHNHAHSQIRPPANSNLHQNTYNQFPPPPPPTNQNYNSVAHYRRSQDAQDTIRVLMENSERNRERRDWMNGHYRGQHIERGGRSR